MRLIPFSEGDEDHLNPHDSRIQRIQPRRGMIQKPRVLFALRGPVASSRAWSAGGPVLCEAAPMGRRGWRGAVLRPLGIRGFSTQVSSSSGQRAIRSLPAAPHRVGCLLRVSFSRLRLSSPDSFRVAGLLCVLTPRQGAMDSNTFPYLLAPSYTIEGRSLNIPPTEITSPEDRDNTDFQPLRMGP